MTWFEFAQPGFTRAAADIRRLAEQPYPRLLPAEGHYRADYYIVKGHYLA